MINVLVGIVLILSNFLQYVDVQIFELYRDPNDLNGFVTFGNHTWLLQDVGQKHPLSAICTMDIHGSYMIL